MKIPIFLPGLSMLLAGCAGTEPEVAVVPSIPTLPAFYAHHADGIVDQPTDGEVAQAVAFGSGAKDDPGLVKMAYLSEPRTTTVSTEAFRIIVRTPLYLIARHSMEQARDGQAPSPKYIAFARHLKFVRIAVSQQLISLATWHAYAIDRKLSLLRDGVRVTPASSIPAWNGADPFLDSDDPWASWLSNSFLKHGVEDMEVRSLRQKEETLTKTASGRGANGQPAVFIALEPDAAVYPIEELRKPGRYEIAFRPAAEANTSQEVRISISFSRFP